MRPRVQPQSHIPAAVRELQNSESNNSIGEDGAVGDAGSLVPSADSSLTQTGSNLTLMGLLLMDERFSLPAACSLFRDG